jgi:hypothetical protein
LGERDCGARSKKQCHGNGKHLVHKARLLANRLFSELNVFRAAAFRRLERPISVISDETRIIIESEWPEFIHKLPRRLDLARSRPSVRARSSDAASGGRSIAVTPMALKRKKIVDPSLVNEQQPHAVFSGGWEIGRIFQEVDGLPEYKWSCAILMNGPIGKRYDCVASLEEAQEQLREAWGRWKAWAELEERPGVR